MFKSRFAGDAAIYTISNFVVAGVPFLLMPILTRVLSPGEYGMVTMFGVVVSFFLVATGLNTYGALMVRFFESDMYSIPEYVTTILSICLVSAFFLALIVLLFSDQLTAVTSIPLKWLILAVAVSVMQFLVQVLLTLFQASKQPIKYGVFRFSHALMDGLFSICFVVVMLYSWQGRLLGIALAWLVVSILALYWLRRRGWLVCRVNRAYASDALQYGLSLVPHVIGGLMLGIIDRLMIANLLDVGSVGIYMVAVQIGMILGIAADAFNRAFAPWLMENLHKDDMAQKKSIVKYTYLYFIIIISVALMGSVLAPSFLSLLVGSQYQASSSIIVYILLGNAFMGMYYMVTNYVFFKRRTGLLSILTISVGLLTLLLSWFLIQKTGIKGAAQSFMFGQGLLFIGAWVLAQYCHNMPWLYFRDSSK